MTIIKPKINPEWYAVLENEFNSQYFIELKEFLISEKQKYNVFPKGSKIFSAFDLTPFSQVKVVIIGQDPYHGMGQAHGLCFSVPDGVTIPPSLRNIYKELNDDLNIPISNSGNLTRWARQGVLLLKAILTVRENCAGSHQGKGWENFTNAAIKAISEKLSGVVFMLWGNYAQEKQSLIDTSKHYVLKAAHPSPLSASRGFFGCKHFSKTQEILKANGYETINWT
ncbi:MAG: uracil-DNA glycosylase [Bacteroidales bacterium]